MNTQFETNKLMNYLGTLTDILEKHECFVAGGAIASLYNGLPINDIDIYFRSEKHLIKFLYEVFEDGDWVINHTKKATLVISEGVEIQMIHFRYFETAQDIFDTFDYTVCMGAYDFKNDEFVFHDDFMKHNSQRILKFNKNTAFPLISLLRVQKYKEKGYSISKPEMLRIAMACMMLEINDYEELKDQLGGMYGVSFDKLFNEVENEEFNMATAIDKIADIVYDEDYFKMPDPVQFETVEDIIDNIINLEVKYFMHGKSCFRIRENGTLRRIRRRKKNVNFLENEYDIPDNWVQIDPAEYFDNHKFYKFVTRNGDSLVSFYKETFKYEVGCEAFVAEKNTFENNCLYFNEWDNINNSTYADRKNKILIEVSIKAEDFCDCNSALTATRCTVIREVPEEEYIGQLK